MGFSILIEFITLLTYKIFSLSSCAQFLLLCMKGEVLYMHAPHQHANSTPPFRKVCMATGMHSLLMELIELQVSEVQGSICLRKYLQVLTCP